MTAMRPLITSRRNPLVQQFRKVRAGDRGAGDQRMLVDGLRLIDEAIAANARFDGVLVTEACLREPRGAAIVERLFAAGVEPTAVTREVLEAASPAETPEGIVAIIRRPHWTDDELFGPGPALVVGLLELRDPGNVGAIARTAEAGGVTGMVVTAKSSDPFSWKALRGSMGSLFRLPVRQGVPGPQLIDWLRRHNVRVYGTVPRGRARHIDVDLRGPCAILFGTEAVGLPPEMVAACDATISLPMAPAVESLNVAAAAALIIYEAARQREFRFRPRR